MGRSGFDTCDFAAYTFKGLIVVRSEFDVSCFDSLIQYLSSFYIKIKLPRIVSTWQTNGSYIHIFVKLF